MKNITIVAGARPNFIKISLFKKLAPAYDINVRIVHSGQHSEYAMSQVFLEQLGISIDTFLEIDGTSPASQIGSIIIKLEDELKKNRPDALLIVGDVNSGLAAAITANKMGLRIGHIESGLRSFDRSMPEEINRIIMDEITDYFFITEQSGMDNLLKEGKKKEQLFMVGNTMIDTLVAMTPLIMQSDIINQLDVGNKEYILFTMHRPANVDNEAGLGKMIRLLKKLSGQYKIVFPMHPRTRNKLTASGMLDVIDQNENVLLVSPLDYIAFQRLVVGALAVLTDSGGVQEETTFKQIPCLTIRESTERPSTIEYGTNELVPFDIDVIESKVADIKQGRYKQGKVPPMWDGNSTARILGHLKNM